MELLEERIRTDGRAIGTDILKVDSFLNHQLDVELLDAIGEEFYRLFRDAGVTRILTIEASGIAIACLTARHFGVPVVFAKKSRSRNIGDDVYAAEVASFTHGSVNTVVVSKSYLHEGDRVLILDDFLANGEALAGLISLVEQAGAQVVGAGICVEKAFQGGGERIRAAGVRVESLARVSAMHDGVVEFC